jgi:hypothetical protein
MGSYAKYPTLKCWVIQSRQYLYSVHCTYNDIDGKYQYSTVHACTVQYGGARVHCHGNPPHKAAGVATSRIRADAGPDQGIKSIRSAESPYEMVRSTKRWSRRQPPTRKSTTRASRTSLGRIVDEHLLSDWCDCIRSSEDDDWCRRWAMKMRDEWCWLSGVIADIADGSSDIPNRTRWSLALVGTYRSGRWTIFMYCTPYCTGAGPSYRTDPSWPDRVSYRRSDSQITYGGAGPLTNWWPAGWLAAVPARPNLSSFFRSGATFFFAGLAVDSSRRSCRPRVDTPPLRERARPGREIGCRKTSSWRNWWR